MVKFISSFPQLTIFFGGGGEGSIVALSRNSMVLALTVLKEQKKCLFYKLSCVCAGCRSL